VTANIMDGGGGRVSGRGTSLRHQVCVKLLGMAEKRTKADKQERQTELLEKRVERHPDEIEKKPSILAPKSGEPTVLIPIDQQIQQRAYELYERRGRTGGHDLDDWLQAECEIKGKQAKAAKA
jgi:superfamily I DNA/RNA helicase